MVFPLGSGGREKAAEILPVSATLLPRSASILPGAAALLPGSAAFLSRATAGVELTICCEGAQVAKNAIWAPQSTMIANKFFMPVHRYPDKISTRLLDLDVPSSFSVA